jgi:hypothetical protein
MSVHVLSWCDTHTHKYELIGSLRGRQKVREVEGWGGGRGGGGESRHANKEIPIYIYNTEIPKP